MPRNFVYLNLCNVMDLDKSNHKFKLMIQRRAGLEVIKLEFILRLKIKHNDWLLADTCQQAANHCALF